MVIIFHTETVYREKNQKSNLDTRRKTSYTAANRFKLINMKGGWVMKNLGGTARLFKALADENRLHILELLQRGERCACVLLENLHLSQPTLSHHMKILCDAGVVTGRKEGKWVYYTLNHQAAGELEALLQELFQEKTAAEPDDCHCSRCR